MKFKKVTRSLMAALVTALAMSSWAGAQNAPVNSQTPRYRLIDLGTFGGPASYLTDPGNGRGILVLNNQGMVAGRASTSTPDPGAPNACSDSDCFLSHAFRWSDGVLTDLGTLPGGNFSQASGINARGWVVVGGANGEIDPLTGSPVFRGALWKDGQLIDLGTLDGGLEVNAVYVNNGGQVVGFASVGTNPDPSGFSFLIAPIHPFIWKDGVMRDLGTFGGADALPAPNCNNQRENLVTGVFFGSAPDPNTGMYPVSAFLWDNGKAINIGTLGGTELFELLCANNAGQVAGGSTLAGDLIMHAFLWDKGSMHDLGTLGGTFSIASWLNDAGEVVGGATTPDDASFHATLWRHGQIVDLGTLEGDCASFALANNAQGQILGESYSCDGTGQRTFLWDKGVIIDLNTVIPPGSNLQLAWATNINDRGEIVGRGLPPGCFEDDQSRTCGHAFLLVPCDAAGAEGCQGNADAAAGINSATAKTNMATASPDPQRTKEFVDRLRARLAQRFPKRAGGK
jgi:probable HAF family extracellular repeat protein